MQNEYFTLKSFLTHLFQLNRVSIIVYLYKSLLLCQIYVSTTSMNRVAVANRYTFIKGPAAFSFKCLLKINPN